MSLYDYVTVCWSSFVENTYKLLKKGLMKYRMEARSFLNVHNFRSSINELDEQVHTRAALRALAEERSHAVVAGGAGVARRAGTVVDVLAAVVPGPAVHTHALVAAEGVVARAAVLAGVGHQLALVNVLPAELTCGRTRGVQRVKILIWFRTPERLGVAAGFLTNESTYKHHSLINVIKVTVLTYVVEPPCTNL